MVRSMWEHYKRTFFGMQVVIALITAWIYLSYRLVPAALIFFLVMQVGSVLGAAWAQRLRRKVEVASLGQRAR
jgi:hypothetical protein